MMDETFVPQITVYLATEDSLLGKDTSHILHIDIPPGVASTNEHHITLSEGFARHLLKEMEEAFDKLESEA